MEEAGAENVQTKPSTDVLRKKLEAELRATEEIARIKQSVIEKRLAVELATLGEEPPGGLRVQPQQRQQSSSKPAYRAIPKLAPYEPRKVRALRRPIIMPESELFLQEATSSAFAGVKLQKSPFSLRFRRSPSSRSSITVPSFFTYSRKHEIPDFFMPLRSDSRDNEDEEDEEELNGDVHQPRRRGSFFKGVMKKFKRRLRSDDREQE